MNTTVDVAVLFDDELEALVKCSRTSCVNLCLFSGT